MRRTARAIVVAVAAGPSLLTACSRRRQAQGQGRPGRSRAGRAAAVQAQITFGDAAASNGPGRGRAGRQARRHDQRLPERDSYTHLDPAQIYVVDEGQLATLIHRGLTNYKQDDKGKYTVVGDLATDSGKQSDGGKTWTYTLKDGIKFEDGNADHVQGHPPLRRAASSRRSSPTARRTSSSGWPLAAPTTASCCRTARTRASTCRTPSWRPRTPRPSSSTSTRPRPDPPQALAMAGYAQSSRRRTTPRRSTTRPRSPRPVQDRRLQGRQVHEAGEEHQLGPEDRLGAPPVRRRLTTSTSTSTSDSRPSG